MTFGLDNRGARAEGPTVLSVGACVGCLDTFLSPIRSVLSPPLLETNTYVFEDKMTKY